MVLARLCACVLVCAALSIAFSSLFSLSLSVLCLVLLVCLLVVLEGETWWLLYMMAIDFHKLCQETDPLLVTLRSYVFWISLEEVITIQFNKRVSS